MAGYYSLGSLIKPYVEEVSEYYLGLDDIGPFQMTGDDLQEFFALENIPIKTRDGLYWSDNIGEDWFRDH